MAAGKAKEKNGKPKTSGTVRRQDSRSNKDGDVSFAKKTNRIHRERLSAQALRTGSAAGPSAAQGGAAQQRGGDKGKAKHGFRVGPKPQKGVYTGKAEKIKASLIHNAKVKRDYAKLLKQRQQETSAEAGSPDEDMASEAGSDSALDEDEVAGDHADGADVPDEDVEIPSPGKDTKEGDVDMLESPKKVRGKGKQRLANVERSDTPPIDFDEPARPILRKRKSSQLEKDTSPAPSDSQDTQVGTSASAQQAPYVHPSRRPDNRLSKHQQRIEDARRAQDAAGEGPAKKRVKLSEEEVEALRQKREEDKKAWTKKGRKGQPNLGSRIGVLLGKIERTTRR